ncbi:MAG: hypothetical protein ACJA0Q_000264 [Saprospiraceae bacterium]|jgi:hypothetical protein
MKKIISILLIAFLGFTSCEYDREEEEEEAEIALTLETPSVGVETGVTVETAVEVSYLVSIRPIIETSCKTQQGPGTGCHDAWIDDYQAIKNSLNIGAWQNVVLETKRMPAIPNSFGIDSLSASEYATMSAWINQGYKEN